MSTVARSISQESTGLMRERSLSPMTHRVVRTLTQTARKTTRARAKSSQITWSSTRATVTVTGSSIVWTTHTSTCWVVQLAPRLRCTQFHMAAIFWGGITSADSTESYALWNVLEVNKKFCKILSYRVLIDVFYWKLLKPLKWHSDNSCSVSKFVPL